MELLGVVVEVIKAEKYTLFTLDDATGCIQCLLWRPMERSFTTTKGSKGFRMPPGAPMSQVSSEARMALEVNQERYALLMDKVHLGSQLKVQGKLHRFQGALQIKCLSLRKSSMHINGWMYSPLRSSSSLTFLFLRLLTFFHVSQKASRTRTRRRNTGWILPDCTSLSTSRRSRRMKGREETRPHKM